MELQSSTKLAEKDRQNLNDLKIANIVYNASKTKGISCKKIRVNNFNSSSLYAHRTFKKSFEGTVDDKLMINNLQAQNNAEECLEQYFVSECQSKTPEKRIKECRSTNSSQKEIKTIKDCGESPEKCKSKIKYK